MNEILPFDNKNLVVEEIKKNRSKNSFLFLSVCLNILTHLSWPYLVYQGFYERNIHGFDFNTM